MNKPNDYDSAPMLVEGDLPPGGYVCQVKKIEETASKNGNAMLKIALDIYEGQYAGFYQDKFDSNTRLGKKWPSVFNQLIYDKDGNTNRSFKSFCEKMKESNGIEIPWGDHFCSALKGKLIGVTFGREQFEGNDGMLHWTTKPKYWKTVSEIREGKYTVPEDRPLKQETSTAPQGFDAISDEDLPF